MEKCAEIEIEIEIEQRKSVRPEGVPINPVDLPSGFREICVNG